MYTKNVLLAYLAATVAIAAPLNINLGAYSPALVVGDGEISFGGGEGGAGEAATLVDTLAGAQVSGGAAAPAATVAAENKPAKRDIGGFTTALNYAAAALKTSPGVELGTGEGGSGVGITVKPGGAVA